MSMMKDFYYETIIGGYQPDSDGFLRSPERNHSVDSPILGPEERPTAQGRGWINHLKSKEDNMISHSTPKVKVYGFSGIVRYAHPGMTFEPIKTREEFGEWRDTKSQDGKKVADWLVKNGYRMVWRKFEGTGESRKYIEYWALRSLPWVGSDTKRVEISPRELKQRIQEDEDAKATEDLAQWAMALIGS